MGHRRLGLLKDDARACPMTDAIVVGAGLFGQIITKALRAEGRHVQMLDARYKGAGSKPAACLMKPSWFSSLGKDVYEPSLRLLDELYGVQDVVFETRPKLAKATVHWIPPSKILLHPAAINEVVMRIEKNRVITANGYFKAELIIVAAGIWTQMLLPQYPQTGQKGIAFLWPDREENPAFIQPWAPYRQLIGFDRGDGYWISDGTAIKQENWTKAREDQSWHRCAGIMGRIGSDDRDTGRAQVFVGIRPYAKGHKPCLLQEVRPGLWVASGGAKNGTLAAGWCAHVIRERTS